MDVRLEVVHEKTRAKQVTLRRNMIVGRGRDCQLRIPVADVSRQHCKFSLKDGGVYLQDLGSSNGTQVAGKSIPTGQAILLTDGDHITVGPVQFILHMGEESLSTNGPESAHSPLQDTAEFQLVGPPTHGAGQLNDQQIDPEPKNPPAESEPTTNAEPDLPTPETPDEPVIELELSIEPDIERDIEPEPGHNHEQKPLKSRSLFGLFRRRSRESGEEEITDDDLMEETGEDPPPEPANELSADDDGSIAPPQADDTFGTTLEEPPSTPSGTSDASESIFDGEDADAVFPEGSDDEHDSGSDSVSFDFLEQESEEPNNHDDGLNDFLGQFGD